MILKIKCVDAWKLIDQIDAITVDDMITGKDRSVHYEKSGRIYHLEIKTPCYLLNDTGKTIEHIS